MVPGAWTLASTRCSGGKRTVRPWLLSSPVEFFLTERVPVDLPEWYAVDDVLAQLAAPVGPAECHGMLCGLLCARAREPATLWLRDALGRSPDQPPPPPLDELYRQTSQQLDDTTFRFELLLPADTEPLADRTAALASWCSGFSSGLGAGGVADAQLDDEAREFLADLAEIGRVDPATEDSDEAAEEAYTEIVEYLRIGTLTLRTTTPTDA